MVIELNCNRLLSGETEAVSIYNEVLHNYRIRAIFGGSLVWRFVN